jgi:hypothetical protein
MHAMVSTILLLSLASCGEGEDGAREQIKRVVQIACDIALDAAEQAGDKIEQDRSPRL